MNRLGGLHPTVAARLRSQRSAVRADMPPPDMLELSRIFAGLMAGDRAAEARTLDRLSDPAEPYVEQLSVGLVHAWLKETGARDVGELCDRYAQLFNFDVARVYIEERDDDLVDRCHAHAASVLVNEIRASDSDLDSAQLLRTSLQSLFAPFCELAGRAAGFPDGRYRDVCRWLAEIGLQPVSNEPVANLPQLIRDAFARIDFWGSLPSNRQQVMLGPCGAVIAVQLAHQPVENVREWVAVPAKRPASASKSQARLFHNLLVAEIEKLEHEARVASLPF